MATWERAGNLGERLAQVRAALSMSPADFGELLGVVDQSVRDYESGNSRPSKSRLERLARILQIPVAVFQEGGPMPSALPVRPPEPRSPARLSPAGGTRPERSADRAQRELFEEAQQKILSRGMIPAEEAVGWLFRMLRARELPPDDEPSPRAGAPGPPAPGGP